MSKLIDSTDVAKTQKMFWDIPSAALRAGYSARHFRRIIEDAGIPILQINHKFFILGCDLEKWRRPEPKRN